MKKTIAWKGLNIVAVVLITHLFTLTLGKNEIYRIGVSYGETLRDTDDDEPMDLKDLDYALDQLGEQFGDASEVSKLLESESFTEGATFGYYRREILP